eukprot:s660_g32.t1
MNMAPWNYATKFMLRQAELLICQIFIGLEGLAHEQLLVYFPNAFSIVQRIFLSRCMVQPREAVDTGLVAAACTWTAGSDQMAEKDKRWLKLTRLEAAILVGLILLLCLPWTVFLFAGTDPAASSQRTIAKMGLYKGRKASRRSPGKAAAAAGASKPKKPPRQKRKGRPLKMKARKAAQRRLPQSRPAPGPRRDL